MNCMTDRVVAITGASSGIGRATAMTLAEQGASLALAARGAENLRSVAEEIEAAGGRVVALPTDVSDRASVQAFVDSACAAFGRIDALVNNAGIGPISPLDDLRVEDWDAMVDINLKGALNVLAAVLPVLTPEGWRPGRVSEQRDGKEEGMSNARRSIGGTRLLP